MIILPYPFIFLQSTFHEAVRGFPRRKGSYSPEMTFPTFSFRLPFLFPLPVMMFEMIAFYHVNHKIHQCNGKQSGFPVYGCQTLFKNNPAFLHTVPVQHIIKAQQPQKSHNRIYKCRSHHFYFFFPNRIFPLFQKSGGEKWNTRQAQ